MNAQVRSFPSSAEAVAEALAYAEDLAAEMGFPQRLVDPILLALGEAVSNAVRHGNALDARKRVTVGCGWQEGRVVCFVEDEGEGIEASRLASAALPEEVLATSGRGLFIIHAVADRVWLESGGRRLCMAWEAERGDA